MVVNVVDVRVKFNAPSKHLVWFCFTCGEYRYYWGEIRRYCSKVTKLGIIPNIFTIITTTDTHSRIFLPE